MGLLKKSVRIQLFDEQGMISDRLVTQTTEFYTGPKEAHDGEMRIEFTITEKKDAIDAVNYLNTLIGNLPIKTIGKGPGRTKQEVNNDDNFSADKKQLALDLIEANKDNQDSLIKSLREHGFIFVTSDYLKFFVPEGYAIKELHLAKYQWLIRRTKVAKDPKNDKYDPQILFGINIMDKKRSDRVILYTYGELVDRFKVPIPSKKPLTMAKTNLIRYPHYMTEDERLKWGTEHRLLFSDSKKKASKFYMRWFPDIKVGDELKITKEDLLAREANETD